MDLNKYKSTIDTANRVASEGNIELALQIVKYALDNFYIEKESGKEFVEKNNEKIREIEASLTKKYFKYKIKIESEIRKFWHSIVSLLIVCLIISAFAVGTTYIIFGQVNKMASEPIKEVTDSLAVEMAGMADSLKEEIALIMKDVRKEIPGVIKELKDVKAEFLERNKVEVLIRKTDIEDLLGETGN